MSKKNEFHADVANLLQRSITQEATSKVWKQFQKALSFLDQESLMLFREFLDGATPAQLAKSRGITLEETQNWLSRIKKEVSHHLRHTAPVKQ